MMFRVRTGGGSRTMRGNIQRRREGKEDTGLKKEKGEENEKIKEREGKYRLEK